jgi:hypothetical protein
VELRALANSPFNHPTFDNPATNLASPATFGQITGAGGTRAILSGPRCASSWRGATAAVPGPVFRTMMVGFFEGLDSERGIAWRLADSLTLRQFLSIGLDEKTPDHVTISPTRRLLDGVRPISPGGPFHRSAERFRRPSHTLEGAFRVLEVRASDSRQKPLHVLGCR